MHWGIRRQIVDQRVMLRQKLIQQRKLAFGSDGIWEDVLGREEGDVDSRTLELGVDQLWGDAEGSGWDGRYCGENASEEWTKSGHRVVFLWILFIFGRFISDFLAQGIQKGVQLF